jgi:GNAT superfamily N-acetyltransferase
MHSSAAYQGRYARILNGYELTVQQVQNDHVFLATEREVLQGFYSLTGLSSEPELDLLFVVDSSQGSGIGAALFAHMRGIASELGVSSIKIVSHPPAVGFYTRMGAKVVGLKAPSGRVTWERPVLMLEIGAPPDRSFKPKPLRGSA